MMVLEGRHSSVVPLGANGKAAHPARAHGQKPDPAGSGCQRSASAQGMIVLPISNRARSGQPSNTRSPAPRRWWQDAPPCWQCVTGALLGAADFMVRVHDGLRHDDEDDEAECKTSNPTHDRLLYQVKLGLTPSPPWNISVFLCFHCVPGWAGQPSGLVGVDASVLPGDAYLSQIRMRNEKSPDG